MSLDICSFLVDAPESTQRLGISSLSVRQEVEGCYSMGKRWINGV